MYKTEYKKRSHSVFKGNSEGEREMGEHVNPLAVTHLLQQALRSMCIHENSPSQWVYAVFWRILPRNYPPPKWDGQAASDRSGGNRRNWILVWEDGFCNFAASSSTEMTAGLGRGSTVDDFQNYQGLQPEVFFKMSHEIYKYGEGLIGKVASDQGHKWIYKQSHDQELNFLSSWHNSADSHPRTWEAQFQSGVKTIALIAVREGVIQLGSAQKVVEDLSYVVLLRKKFSYIESIPGVLLPHPSSTSFPIKPDSYGGGNPEVWQFQPTLPSPTDHLYANFSDQLRVTPSMNSLEALLAKLPSVVPPLTHSAHPHFLSAQTPPKGPGFEKLPAKEEVNDEAYIPEKDTGENSNSMLAYHYQRLHNHHQKPMHF